MASKRQIEANRRNSANSTGARTARGKAKSSMNRLKHGLRAEALVLPGEDPKELKALWRRLVDDLKPVGVIEEDYVEQILKCIWRRKREGLIETGVWLHGQTGAGGDPAELGKGFMVSADTLALLHRYAVGYDRRLEHLLAGLAREQAHRKAKAAEGATLVEAVDLIAPAPAFPKAKAPEAPTVIDVPVDESEDTPVPATSAAGETAQVVELSFVDGVAFDDWLKEPSGRPRLRPKHISVEGAQSQ